MITTNLRVDLHATDVVLRAFCFSRQGVVDPVGHQCAVLRNFFYSCKVL